MVFVLFETPLAFNEMEGVIAGELLPLFLQLLYSKPQSTNSSKLNLIVFIFIM